jgi:hypothetical protein
MGSIIFLLMSIIFLLYLCPIPLIAIVGRTIMIIFKMQKPLAFRIGLSILPLLATAGGAWVAWRFVTQFGLM